ncbi:hypothetical protein V9516_003348 [Vibrio parahaemolyticus]|uniref:hypothetical protein n=2 Tax=Vibrio parahaemolyticus TaxID=670 RepID=UPI000428499E|nr:hypothetical protein [Vibrio parahaemolyticus]EGQ8066697.1 hypothetical protein [Vibrio parahaemolyticus]EHH2513634.1 hypothetical protein [Vibrio parahaemolyticus]EHZ2645073.1 hypothetical protein [Vibrio parahaemolyticus]EJB1788545.1 hypothetical protein [Vibrio parahaemolyticus]EJE1252444.1 hypothetical protein [Vibrio parahaemolyticus]
MQVEVCKQVILDEAKLEEVYIQLRAFRGKHRLGYNSYSEIMNCNHISEEYKVKFKHLFEITSTLISFKKTITVVLKPAHDNEIKVEQLHDVLSTKSFVILENEHHDLNFLKTALNSARHGPDLMKIYNTSWMVRGAGGCGDIPKLIEKCANEQSNIPRLLVINDSDLYYRADVPRAPQSTIIDTATQHAAVHIMLSKREIENYIPINVLEKVFDSQYPKLIEFRKWSTEQRDFFDFKIGFPKKCPHTDERYNGLYHNLNLPKDHDFTSGGFGKDISDKAFTPCYKEEFSFDKLKNIDPHIHQEFDKIKQSLLSIL